MIEGYENIHIGGFAREKFIVLIYKSQSHDFYLWVEYRDYSISLIRGLSADLSPLGAYWSFTYDGGCIKSVYINYDTVIPWIDDEKDKMTAFLKYGAMPWVDDNIVKQVSAFCEELIDKAKL